MTDSVFTLAANMIEPFESDPKTGTYSPVAYWDVNHYRLGYGSDTEGPEQINVVKGMHTTAERAFENLEARIPQFEKAVLNQVEETAWAILPDQAKAALLSMAYNYGDLPANVAYAVQHRDSLALIASAVEARAGDNHGVNKARRMKEAAYIASADKPAPKMQADIAYPAKAPVNSPVAILNTPAPIDVSTVRGLQTALNLLVKTNPALVVDGSYGAFTVAKMKAFQASEKLKPTGDTTFNSALAVREALQKAGIPVAPIT